MTTYAPARTRGSWSVAQPWLAVVARLGLAAVWLAAGATKLTEPQVTVRAVRAYQLLPEASVKPIAYALPWFEVALAVLLILGLGIRLAATASALLLVLFIIGIASAGIRGLQIDCGCFGGGGQVAPGATRYLQELARDSLFLGVASFLAVFPRSRLSLDAVLLPPLVDAEEDDLDDE